MPSTMKLRPRKKRLRKEEYQRDWYCTVRGCERAYANRNLLRIHLRQQHTDGIRTKEERGTVLDGVKFSTRCQPVVKVEKPSKLVNPPVVAGPWKDRELTLGLAMFVTVLRQHIRSCAIFSKITVVDTKIVLSWPFEVVKALLGEPEETISSGKYRKVGWWPNDEQMAELLGEELMKREVLIRGTDQVDYTISMVRMCCLFYGKRSTLTICLRADKVNPAGVRQGCAPNFAPIHFYKPSGIVAAFLAVAEMSEEEKQELEEQRQASMRTLVYQQFLRRKEIALKHAGSLEEHDRLLGSNLVELDKMYSASSSSSSSTSTSTSSHHEP